MSKPFIVCSAIWYKELPLVKDNIPSELLRPKNLDTGIVFFGLRHPHCLYQMVAITGKSSYLAGESIQGFLTSDYRFVDRAEAALIHIDNGGTVSYFGGKELDSSDLY